MTMEQLKQYSRLTKEQKQAIQANFAEDMTQFFQTHRPSPDEIKAALEKALVS